MNTANIVLADNIHFTGTIVNGTSIIFHAVVGNKSFSYTKHFDDANDAHQCITAIAQQQVENRGITENTLKLKVACCDTLIMQRIEQTGTLTNLHERLVAVENYVQVLLQRKPILVRSRTLLAQCQEIKFHQQNTTITESVPLIPNATAIILSVYHMHGNNPNGHGYLNLQAYQQGSNKATASAILKNQHYNWYANSDYYEVMLPWNSALPSQLVIELTNTYNTGSYSNSGNQNYYTLNIEGYLAFQ